MPTYYFDLHHDDELFADEEGSDLPNEGSAVYEGIAALAEMASDYFPQKVTSRRLAITIKAAAQIPRVRLSLSFDIEHLDEQRPPASPDRPAQRVPMETLPRMQWTLNPLVQKLSQHDDLSDDEVGVLNAISTHQKTFFKHQDVVSEGDRPSVSCLLLQGYCARYKVLQTGARQITAIHVPGDFVDLHSFLIKTMDHGVMCLTECQIAEVPHPVLRQITQDHPHLSRLLWLSTLTDAAIHREWLTAMGARSAIAHMAHFLCEMNVRLEIVGLAKDGAYELPMTQQKVGDALGLTAVHINRTLQELRGQGLISWQGRQVRILKGEQLIKVAEFDPTYLSIKKEPR